MIDVQTLASQCGLEPRGSDYDRETGRWDDDTDLHIVGQDGVSLPFLRAFAMLLLAEHAAGQINAIARTAPATVEIR